jgi:hypothetical protein
MKIVVYNLLNHVKFLFGTQNQLMFVSNWISKLITPNTQFLINQSLSLK